jgi:hypothetical protein
LLPLGKGDLDRNSERLVGLNRRKRGGQTFTGLLKIEKVELPVSENSTESTKRGGIGAQNGHKTGAGCRIFCSENAVFQ